MHRTSSRPASIGIRRSIRMPSRLIQLLFAVLHAVPLPLAFAQPASAGGGVNIPAWCRRDYNSGYFNAVSVANNVYGWRCQYGSDTGTRLNVDMNNACAYQYGAPGPARYSNYYDKYSWYCV